MKPLLVILLTVISLSSYADYDEIFSNSFFEQYLFNIGNGQYDYNNDGKFQKSELDSIRQLHFTVSQFQETHIDDIKMLDSLKSISIYGDNIFEDEVNQLVIYHQNLEYMFIYIDNGQVKDIIIENSNIKELEVSTGYRPLNLDLNINCESLIFWEEKIPNLRIHNSPNITSFTLQSKIDTLELDYNLSNDFLSNINYNQQSSTICEIADVVYHSNTEHLDYTGCDMILNIINKKRTISDLYVQKGSFLQLNPEFKGRIEVFNLDGSVVYKKSNQETIDLNHLHGIYILKLEGTGSVREKIYLP